MPCPAMPQGPAAPGPQRRQGAACPALPHGTTAPALMPCPARPHNATVFPARPHNATICSARPHDATACPARPHNATVCPARPHSGARGGVQRSAALPRSMLRGRRLWAVSLALFLALCGGAPAVAATEGRGALSVALALGVGLAIGRGAPAGAEGTGLHPGQPVRLVGCTALALALAPVLSLPEVAVGLGQAPKLTGSVFLGRGVGSGQGAHLVGGASLALALGLVPVLGLPVVAAGGGGGGGKEVGQDPKLIGSVAKLETQLGQAMSGMQQLATQKPTTKQPATAQLPTQKGPTEAAPEATAEAVPVRAGSPQANAETARADARATANAGAEKVGGGTEGEVTENGVTQEAAPEGAAAAQQTEPPQQLACPSRPSVLYSADKVHAAQDIAAGRHSRLLAWEPPEDDPKYLVLFCRYGQMTNRMICVRNSIILAGLLNRTLVVDTLQPEYSKRHYSYTILLDTDHLKRCFGAGAVTTTEELKLGQGQGQGGVAQRGDKRGRLTIDKVLCWAVSPVWEGTEFRIKGTTCLSPEEACKDLDLTKFRKTFTLREREEGFRQNLCARSLQEVLEQYGRWAGEKVIVAGDLALLGMILPQDFTAATTDVPFKRVSGCPSPLAILPHPDIVKYAQQLARNLFSGQSFLALHLRRKDFVTHRCQKLHWVSACTPVDKVAQCVAQEMNATGIPNLVLCSDAKGREALLSEAMGRAVPTALNPRLPPEMAPLTGRSKEGNAVLQKLIMARAAVFLGTDHSSFTGDVQRLRHGTGAASCRDRFICEGTAYEVPTLDLFLSMLQ